MNREPEQRGGAVSDVRELAGMVRTNVLQLDRLCVELQPLRVQEKPNTKWPRMLTGR